MQETTIETKKCKKCGTSFEITDKDIKFYDKISPSFGGVKYNIPTPTLCPDCRLQRRLSFRNERKLYKRKCDYSGKDIVSTYSPDTNYKVYNPNLWWSDKWDALDYGQNFDFDRPFFQQFEELFKNVPKLSLTTLNCENCDYTNQIIGSKDCYLIFSGYGNDSCLYGRNIRDSRNSIDCLQIFNSENCYECIIALNCNNLKYGFHTINCSDSSYLFDCYGCNHCYGCINLNNRKYCIFNKQYTKDNYKKKIEKLKNISFKKMLKKDFFINKAHRNLYLFENRKNCEIDFIRNSYNIKESYNIAACENIKFGIELESSNDIYDVFISGKGCSLSYESIAIGMNSSKLMFCVNSSQNYNVLYSDFCISCSNCFGCAGLINKQYCIFNKQYTKGEYKKVAPKIIKHMKETGEWGEFFPSFISPFGYNETIAQEYFPLEELEAKEKGFKRMEKEYPINIPKGIETVKAKELPESIEEIDDSILNKAIICEVTGKPFRIIKPELEFYKKHNLPIPKRYPDQRHLDRMKLRNPRKLYDRKCDKCGVEIKTTYSPEREEIVYCESCYNKEVY